MRMYFRTNYYAGVGIDEVVQLEKGNTYEVITEADGFYFIVVGNKPFRKTINIAMVPKEDLEDDVYVVTGKSEKLDEGGGVI